MRLCTLSVLHVQWRLSVACAASEQRLYFKSHLRQINNGVMKGAASHKHRPKVQVVLRMLSDGFVVLIRQLTQTLACTSAQAWPQLCSVCVCVYCVLTNISYSIYSAALKPGLKSGIKNHRKREKREKRGLIGKPINPRHYTWIWLAAFPSDEPAAAADEGPAVCFALKIVSFPQTVSGETPSLRDPD